MRRHGLNFVFSSSSVLLPGNDDKLQRTLKFERGEFFYTGLAVSNCYLREPLSIYTEDIVPFIVNVQFLEGINCYQNSTNTRLQQEGENV
jgi:hypothetical protein